MRAKRHKIAKIVPAHFGVPRTKNRVFRQRTVIGLLKRKTPQSIGITTFLASWKGLEPPACRLGGDRSIQLSYQDVYKIVCQIVKDVHALRRRTLYPAELRGHISLCRRADRPACVILPHRRGKGKDFSRCVRPPERCRISDNPFPERSTGSGGPAPAGGPRSAGAQPPRPPRPGAASRGTVRPS